MQLRPVKPVGGYGKLYVDCRLPLDKFIDALIDQDLEGLIISGKPSEEQIREAWGKIYLQYCELSDSGQTAVVEKIKQIQLMTARISVCSNIAAFFEISYDADLVVMLNNMGIQVVLEPGDERTKAIKRINAFTKRWITEKEVAQKELDGLQVEQGDKIGREYFEDWLDALSQLRKYSVQARDMSVMQFIRAIKKASEQYAKSK